MGKAYDSKSLMIAVIWLAVAVSFVVFFKEVLVALVFVAIAGYFFYRAATWKLKPGGACCS